MSLYEVAFSGELIAGARLDLVKANVAKIFQADEQRMALLFSGRRIVIKSNLDAAGAERYRETLARAGALVEVRALDVAAAPAPASQAGTVSPVAAASGDPQIPASPVGKLKIAPRDEYMAAFIDVEAPDFGIAPLGVDLQDEPAAVAAPKVDLSQFSLAPPGSDMGQEKRPPAGPPPDVSHLKLQ
ncbi:hypothetical protein [Pseudomonas sp. N040]|uniref:hypothetical protein n=1 Tax=Pseudomonas sp. N040 TaxID=2785325 RepID=UPI0018A30B3E|nr:hypothetical protein [Pseudomonas sp. N040]MBF7730587.1 hypothetical protein [Pseudomonas sp. N040]MBW7014231.1 hypothetical protein [Pseudomonas sp. N040]